MSYLKTVFGSTDPYITFVRVLFWAYSFSVLKSKRFEDSQKILWTSSYDALQLIILFATENEEHHLKNSIGQ